MHIIITKFLNELHHYNYLYKWRTLFTNVSTMERGKWAEIVLRRVCVRLCGNGFPEFILFITSCDGYKPLETNGVQGMKKENIFETKYS